MNKLDNNYVDSKKSILMTVKWFTKFRFNRKSPGTALRSRRPIEAALM